MNLEISGNYALTLGESTFLTNTKKIYLQCRTSLGAVNISLPRISLPSGVTTTWGFEIYVNDIDGNAGTNNITITPFGTEKINGVNAPIIVSTNGATGSFEAAGTSAWKYSSGEKSANISGIQLLGQLLQADLNTTDDQLITLAGGTKFIITDIVFANASIDLNTVRSGQIWTGLLRSGIKVCSTAVNFGVDQAFTTMVNADHYVRTGSLAGEFVQDDYLVAISNNNYFSVSVVQGAPATMDIYVFGYILG